jgi:Flp pilus assembly protein TadG
MKINMKARKGERGSALIEAALTLPLLLLVSVGIFEFGRVFQTWQVLTNAAREGARMAVLPGMASSDVQTRVRQYLQDGQLGDYAGATIVIDRTASISIGVGTASTSVVTVNYPFNFMVLNPVARLVVSNSTLGAPITISAAAEMRNESQF